MEMTIRSDVFGLSSTKHLRRNAVLHPGNDVAMMCWLCQLISQWGVGLQHLRPDSAVWPVHMYFIWPCQARQEYSCTLWSIGGLKHLPPQMKHHGLNEEKPYRKKIPLYWVEWSVHVVSLDTNNRKHKSTSKSGEQVRRRWFLTLFLLVIYSTNGLLS